MHPRHGTVMLIGLAVVSVLGLLALRTPTASLAHPVPLPVVMPNPNTRPAGELRDGVLSVTLEATMGMWHPNGDSLPGIPIEAFAELGRAPQAAGPLLRVPLGTEIRASVRNSLQHDSLKFYVHMGAVADSIDVAPGATAELRVRPTRPGNFLYRATTTKPLNRPMRFGGLLAGALIVDSAGVIGPPRDRVFVMLVATDSTFPGTGFPVPERSVWAINGRSWPHTERFTAAVGDTVRWRWINGTDDQHPMHLHGFYFSVDDFDGPAQATSGQGALKRRVVTERMGQFTTMSMTWVPERSGNWLFHCHFAEHVVPHGPLSPNDGAPRIGAWHDRAMVHHGNHAETGMAGLVVAIDVRPRGRAAAGTPERPRRRLRLIAVQDSGSGALPSMRFQLVERGKTNAPLAVGRDVSPTLELVRGEPVAITIVNHMREPTSVHWHGMELESFFDGVAGFSGSGRRLAPIIAPRDSFEARFTPPRAGTFIYHSHVDEVRQHRAGLLGAMIVRDPGPVRERESILLIKSPRIRPPGPTRVEINGSMNPDTIVLAAGVPHRLRFIAMQGGFPNATVTITARRDSSHANLADTMLVRWRPVAKDGAELPDAARDPGMARQSMGMGETYDFELTPEQPGALRIEIRNARGLVGRVPIIVQ